MNRYLPGTLLRHLLWFTLTVLPLSSHAIEEPKYEVIRQFDNVELRQYAPYVVAEVVLEAAAEDAGRRAHEDGDDRTGDAGRGGGRHARAVRVARGRYSGTRSQANYDEHLGKLQAALAAAGVATQGQPVLARYNSPMTPWFMRRNEIWLALR